MQMHLKEDQAINKEKYLWLITHSTGLTNVYFHESILRDSFSVCKTLV